MSSDIRIFGALVRRESRSDLPLLGCLAVLVLVLAALGSAGPLLLARQQDTALSQRITAAQRNGPLLDVAGQFTLDVAAGYPASAAPAVPLRTVLPDSGRDLAGSFGPVLGPTTHPERTTLALPWGDYLSTTALADGYGDVSLQPLWVSDADAHVRYVQGQAPSAAAVAKGAAPDIALSQAQARALGLSVGERFQVASRTDADQNAPLSYRLSGIYRPVDTGDDFWTAQAELDQVQVETPTVPGQPSPLVVQGLVGAGAADSVSTDGFGYFPVDWYYRMDLGRAANARSAPVVTALATLGNSLQQGWCGALDGNGNPECSLDGQTVTTFAVNDTATPLLTAFAQENRQFEALASFAVASLLAVGLATVVVAVRLLLRRRAGDLALRRSRGASTTELLLSRMATTVPVALLAGAGGWILGRLLAPSGTSGHPLPELAIGSVAAAVLLVPLLTWYTVREPGTARRSRQRRPVAARRYVLEGTGVLLCVAGVTALRVRGSGGGSTGGGIDVQLSTVPVLVALTTVLVLVRLYPVVLRLLAAWARRGGGTVAFVGLRRAGRDAPATSLALFVLVLTLGTAVFGGLISRSIQDGTAVGARWTTGADAVSVAAGNIAPGAVAPGLAGPGAVRAELVENLRVVNLTGDGDGQIFNPVALVTLDPKALAAAEPGSPLAAQLSALAAGPITQLGDGSDVLPVLAVAAIADHREQTGTYSANAIAAVSGHHPTRVRPEGTLDRAAQLDPVLGPLLDQQPPGTLLLVGTTADDAVLPLQSSGSTAALLWARPGAAPAALRAAAATALQAPQTDVQLQSDVLTALRTDGLTRAVGRIYTVCTALAVLFALLAVALELVLTARERGRTTSYLRTLGLASRGAAGLQILQLVPLAAAAAAGGVLLGLVVPRVLGPALQIQQFTGGPTGPALHTDYSLTLVLGAGLALLVLGAAAVETAVARLRRLESVLRLGEQ